MRTTSWLQAPSCLYVLWSPCAFDIWLSQIDALNDSINSVKKLNRLHLAIDDLLHMMSSACLISSHNRHTAVRTSCLCIVIHVLVTSNNLLGDWRHGESIPKLCISILIMPDMFLAPRRAPRCQKSQKSALELDSLALCPSERM